MVSRQYVHVCGTLERYLAQMFVHTPGIDRDVPRYECDDGCVIEIQSQTIFLKIFMNILDVLLIKKSARITAKVASKITFARMCVCVHPQTLSS